MTYIPDKMLITLGIYASKTYQIQSNRFIFSINLHIIRLDQLEDHSSSSPMMDSMEAVNDILLVPGVETSASVSPKSDAEWFGLFFHSSGLCSIHTWWYLHHTCAPAGDLAIFTACAKYVYRLRIIDNRCPQSWLYIILLRNINIFYYTIQLLFYAYHDLFKNIIINIISIFEQLPQWSRGKPMYYIRKGSGFRLTHTDTLFEFLIKLCTLL